MSSAKQGVISWWSLADANFSYPTWEMTLQQLAEPARQGRLIVILDEFSYAVEVEPSLPSVLQNVWDQSQQQTEILLGEAKWTSNPLNRKIVRDLVPKRPLVIPDTAEGWRVHYAFFSRSGFTNAAVQEAMQHEAILVDLDLLGQVLDG